MDLFYNIKKQRELLREWRESLSCTKRSRYKPRITSGKFHVFVRGYRQSDLFTNDEERGMFLAILEEVLIETDSTLYAFILMTNHLHLLLETETLPKLMGQTLYRYSKWHNKRWPKSKMIFDRPYGSSPIYSSLLFHETFLYVLSNAKRAYMCDFHEQYFWTSGASYFSVKETRIEQLIKFDKEYARSQYTSQRDLDMDVNSYMPLKRDGKRILTHKVPDSHIVVYFNKLINGRSLKMISNQETDTIIRSLRFSANATYSQIASLIPRSYNYIKNVCSSIE